MTETARETLPVATSVGPGRLHLYAAARPTHVLVASHGAGAGITTVDLQALAQRLPSTGVSVALFEQPWLVAGKKVATAPPTLDVGLRAAVASLPASWQGPPLVLGGRSAGARSACRVAPGLADACLALSFPLHPPGRPEKSRLAELLASGVPTLVVQGGSDAFGRPDEFPAEVELVEIARADHSMKVPRSAGRTHDEVGAEIATAVVNWLVGIESS